MPHKPELPHFIQDQLAISLDLHLSRRHRSKLALLKNLHFYEVQNRRVLSSIDLQNTCLRKVQHKLQSIELDINVARSQGSDGSTCPNKDVTLGKYIYQNLEDKFVYLLLKCWDCLAIVKKSVDGLSLQAEYENVHSFGMHKDSKYQVLLAISFQDNRPQIVTNFQQDHLPVSSLPQAEFDVIKMKQSELLVHQTITKKEFAKLKSLDTFGCNFLRTPQLEDIQILSKCGDAWLKVTANDDIVIGVPLVNNCSTRLTPIRNLRAVLQRHNSADLSYTFALFQLSRKLSDLDNIQAFFQSQDEEYGNDCSWIQCSDLCLRPEAFCVLVLTIKIGELTDFDNVDLSLFVFYDVVVSERTFPQKWFITTLSFQEIFTKESYRLNFDEKHLHRDLLTVVATSYEAKATLEYCGNSSCFEDYLSGKLGFCKISSNQSCSEAMNVDGQDDDVELLSQRILFYNKHCGSVWHGTLLSITHLNHSSSHVRIYTKSQEKSKLFLALLDTELKVNCRIKEVCRNPESLSTRIINFEAALRDECSSYLELCSSSAMKKDRVDTTKKQTLQRQLYLNELKTDMLFKDLHS